MRSIQRVVWLAALLLSSAAARALPASSQEYEVKAAFLYKFGNFVEVPLASEPRFIVTILGDDPFGDAIDATVLGKTIEGRPVRVHRTHSIEEAASSGIVFISRSETPRLREILGALRNTGALTVGDVDGFAAAGGMIGFVVEQKRIRFEINPGAAEQAGIRINAKLLNLARIVATKRQP
jgi:hypothetical protein